MGRFGEDSQAFFARIYQSEVPWETGSIQPDLKELLRAIPPAGRVLDIGCGSGDASIDIARLGYEVLGIDFVEGAIERAKEKLGRLKEAEDLAISFAYGNGLTPSAYGRDFGAIVDSGFMHLFDDRELVDYIDDMHAALAAGGKVYLIEFSLEFEIPQAPRAISRELVETLFGADRWKILALREGSFANKVSPVPATLACVEKRVGSSRRSTPMNRP